MNVYDYLSDFDNSELNEYEWTENMREKVMEYNDEFKTKLNPKTTVGNYISMQREKRLSEPKD